MTYPKDKDPQVIWYLLRIPDRNIWRKFRVFCQLKNQTMAEVIYSFVRDLVQKDKSE